MENITACLEQVNLFLWNGPLLFLLSAAHLFFSCKFFPQKYIGKAIRLSLRPEKNAIRENNARQTSRSITIIETLPYEKVRYDYISKAIPTGYYLLPWGQGNYPVLPHHKAEG